MLPSLFTHPTSTPRHLRTGAWLLGATLLWPASGWAAGAGRGLNGLVWLLLLPAFGALGLGLHSLLARVAKTVASAALPLANGLPEVAGYSRRVYHTADPQMLIVAGVALLGGLLLALGAYTASGWGWTLGLLVVAGAVALDLWWWHRVAVTAEFVWHQQGLRGEVHQVAIENIREVSVDESDAEGLTLRRGRNNNASARLVLELNDDAVIQLPATDAHSALDEVEAVANQVRMRQVQQSGHMALHKDMARAEKTATAQVQAAIDDSASPSEERELKLALMRLRKQALAPDVPRAVKPMGSSNSQNNTPPED